MRAITEDFLRYELRSSQPEVYVIPQGKILTPAAPVGYLQQRKIRVEKEGGYTYTHQLKAPVQKAECTWRRKRKEAPKKPEPTGRPHVVATEVPPPEEVEIPVQVTATETQICGL